MYILIKTGNIYITELQKRYKLPEFKEALLYNHYEH